MYFVVRGIGKLSRCRIRQPTTKPCLSSELETHRGWDRDYFSASAVEIKSSVSMETMRPASRVYSIDLKGLSRKETMLGANTFLYELALVV